jgi:predicted AlkP superfamily pyrophosphatase or phosphodiesterase
MIRSYLWLPLFAAFLSFSCNYSQPQIPKLVITLVVDQMRPDLLTRFDDLYTGGFRWLMDHGIWFTNTHHEHSYTATGPGHIAIGFGQYPGKVGVIGNSFYDRDLKKKVNCVEDPNAKVVGSKNGKARSFSRYNTTGIGDWVKSIYPKSKVISLGGKDRTAIFLGGQNPDLPLYYNKAGSFISSDYYVDKLPDWVNDFNGALNAESYKDSLWTKSLEDDVYLTYAREDFYQGELDDYLNEKYSPVFPIGINPKDDPKLFLMGRPWFERELLNLAKEAIHHENLGQDSNPDLLFIGFSAMDWMIHDFGPHSQEIMDAFIKLDKWLGDFIEFVDETVGLENVQFVLTADHGGLPLPEYVVEQGGSGGRINKEHLNEAFEWIDEEVEERFGGGLYVRSGGNYFLDLEKLKKAGIDPRKIYDVASKYLPKVEGIERMIYKKDVIASTETDKITLRLKHMIHPHKTPEIFPLNTPGYLYKNPYGTSHGSPYDYDTHVPLIFSHKKTKSSFISDGKATVDIAPTIARLLGVKIPDFCDGTAIDF